VSVATPTTGDAWVRAIAEGDEDALGRLLDPDVDFRALTPGGPWEAASAAEVVAIVLGRWFASPRRIESVEQVDHDAVGDRARVGYRYRATTPDGDTVVEQQAYFDMVDDRITWMRVLCTGFRPVGDRGC
jgi:ketosteroid isomerase-like protein